MQTAGGGFAAAIGLNDQIVDYQVTLTLPSGVQASYGDVTKSTVSIDIARSITSDLPDGTSLIAGYSTASATVVLSGYLNQAAGVALVEAQSIYWLMNPNDSTSPMWRTTRGGLPITIKAGLWDGATAADLVTVFTGTVDICQCSEGVVTLVCRDQWSTMTNQATLPPVIENSPFNPALSSEYAIDYLARHASPKQYLSWPALETTCVLACSFRGGIWPEVGTLLLGGVESPLFGPGIYGTGSIPDTINNTLNTFSTSAPITAANKICGRFLSSGPNVILQHRDTTGLVLLEIQRNSGVLFVDTQTAGGTAFQSITVVDTALEIEYSLSWPNSSTSVTGTVWVNGTAHTISFTADNSRPNTNPITNIVTYGYLEGLQIFSTSSYATKYPFVPTMLLDTNGSLNVITALPDVVGQSAAGAMQTIAQAENAVVYFDETGILRFVNRNSIKLQSSARSITSTTSLASLDSLEQMSLCATHIQVPVNQLTIGPVGYVWAASTVLAVSGGTPLTFTATTTSISLGISTTDWGYYVAGTTGAGLTTWQACTTPDGLGSPLTSGITVTVVQTSATQLQVTITNSNAYTAYLVTPNGVTGPVSSFAGSPALVIGGKSVTTVNGSIAADSQFPYQNAVSNTTFGEVLLQVSSNDWLQDLPTAQNLASDLLDDLHYPKPLLRNVSIVADPRLQLLDRVTIVDPDVTQINSDVLAIGIEMQMSDGAWTQSLDARAWARPGAWILGQAGSSELGSTTFVY